MHAITIIALYYACMSHGPSAMCDPQRQPRCLTPSDIPHTARMVWNIWLLLSKYLLNGAEFLIGSKSS